MRRIGLLAVVVCLSAHTARAQEVYASVLLEYLTGDADAAVRRVVALDRDEVLAGLDAFNMTRSRQILTGAAALHTEAALRARVLDQFHLGVATAIVEFGETGRRKSNTGLAIKPLHAAPVSDGFRVLWYGTVITVLIEGTRIPQASRYLDHALALYPADAEIQLLAGIHHEMRGSARISDVSAGARRDARRDAEKHYRAALAANPDRHEARLRLGRVLQQRDELNEARALIEPLTTTADLRTAYLALLFFGGIEDALQRVDSALAAYESAATLIPIAQAARLAASELRHRHGDRRGAADAVPAAAGDLNAFDPWWTYVFGEYWRAATLLNALRGMRRA